ncbi:MAG: carboxyltransferase domain-containing protein, partial [Chitinophagaceae bacterium]|nr:carboxyltransferase domain-containing protein [Chitinophagaceae bacterium]
YHTLTLIYDIALMDEPIEFANNLIEKFATQRKTEIATTAVNKIIEVPVCYDKNFGIDLTRMSTILNYQGYKTAGTAVVLSTAYPFYGIFLGIAHALLSSNSDIKDENLGYPNLNLMENEQYAKGYKQKAKQIKRKKVITNYVSGIAIQAGILVIALIFYVSASK